MTPHSISLRAVEPSDADFMYAMDNDSSCWRYSDTVAPLSRRQLRDYALNYEADPFVARQLRLIVMSSASGVPAGAVDLYDISPIHRHAFVGIYILPEFRQRGYALDALALTASYAARTLHLRILAAKIESANSSSTSLFTKAGYSLAEAIPGWFESGDTSRSDLLLAYLRLRE